MAAGNGNQLISVHPDDLKFIFELEKQIFCDVKVVNNTEHHVAFKVKTTSPRKYVVQPIIGVVQPSDSCVIRVTRQAQSEYPPDMKCKDKFMIQGTIVPSNTNAGDLPADTFDKKRAKEIEETKLKVFYISPSAKGHSECEGLKSSTEQSPDSNSMSLAVQPLKDEKEAAVQQTLQLQQELAVQPLKDEKEAAIRQTLQQQQEMAVQHLKNERDAAARQLVQLQQELDFQKSRRCRTKVFGCFFAFSEFQ